MPWSWITVADILMHISSGLHRRFSATVALNVMIESIGIYAHPTLLEHFTDL